MYVYVYAHHSLEVVEITYDLFLQIRFLIPIMTTPFNYLLTFFSNQFKKRFNIIEIIYM